MSGPKPIAPGTRTALSAAPEQAREQDPGPPPEVELPRSFVSLPDEGLFVPDRAPTLNTGTQRLVMEQIGLQTLPPAPPALGWAEAAPKAPGAGALAIAGLLLHAAGKPSADAARQLAEHPRLAAALELFAPAYAAATTPAQKEQVAARAGRDYVVNAPALDASDLTSIGGTFQGINDWASAYAKDLGYDSVYASGGQLYVKTLQGKSLKLMAVPEGGQSPVLLQRKVGEALNQVRFNRETVVPPHLPAEPQATAFSQANAHLSTHLSQLAYQEEPTVRAQLAAWGFDLASFSWVEDSSTDTQGFVVADPAGNVFVCFRGTASATDAVTDAKVLMTPLNLGTPAGALKVHDGFAGALNSVWPQVTAAIAKARAGAPEGSPLFFTGHSLGGALAELGAMRLSLEHPHEAAGTEVYTIGAPRMGNEAVQTTYNALLPRTFRMVNFKDGVLDVQDAVTQIPPKWMGYRHVGNLVRLDGSGTEVILSSDHSSLLSRAGPGALDVVGSGPGPAPTRSERSQEEGDSSDATVENLKGEELKRYIEGLALNTAEAPGHPPLPAVDGVTASSQGRPLMAVPSTGYHSSDEYLFRMGLSVLHHSGR